MEKEEKGEGGIDWVIVVRQHNAGYCHGQKIKETVRR